MAEVSITWTNPCVEIDLRKVNGVTVFRPGDKVLCIKSIEPKSGGPIEGNTYIVTSVEHHWLGFLLPTFRNAFVPMQSNREIALGRANWNQNNFQLITYETTVTKKKIANPLFYSEGLDNDV